MKVRRNPGATTTVATVMSYVFPFLSRVALADRQHVVVVVSSEVRCVSSSAAAAAFLECLIPREIEPLYAAPSTLLRPCPLNLGFQICHRKVYLWCIQYHLV